MKNLHRGGAQENRPPVYKRTVPLCTREPSPCAISSATIAIVYSYFFSIARAAAREPGIGVSLILIRCIAFCGQFVLHIVQP